MRNARVNEIRQAPRLLQPVLFNLLNEGDQNGGPQDGLLQIHLRDAPDVPKNATHVELILWRKQDLVTPTSTVPLEGHRILLPIDERPIYDTGLIPLPAPEPSIFFWTHQYVTLDDTERRRLAMYPPSNFAFTVEWDEEGPILGWLLGESEASVYALTIPDPALQQGPPITETVSTIVKIDPLISFDDDEEPEDDFDF